nr:hypothetical protein MFMH1_26700 [Myxococcus sp. MH1]
MKRILTLVLSVFALGCSGSVGERFCKPNSQACN